MIVCHSTRSNILRANDPIFSSWNYPTNLDCSLAGAWSLPIIRLPRLELAWSCYGGATATLPKRCCICTSLALSWTVSLAPHRQCTVWWLHTHLTAHSLDCTKRPTVFITSKKARRGSQTISFEHGHVLGVLLFNGASLAVVSQARKNAPAHVPICSYSSVRCKFK